MRASGEEENVSEVGELTHPHYAAPRVRFPAGKLSCEGGGHKESKRVSE